MIMIDTLQSFGLRTGPHLPRKFLKMNLLNQWLKETKQSLSEELKPLKPTKPSPPQFDYREPVERFFSYWNERDMETALSFCDEDCIFEDTLFPRTYNGRDEIRIHLNNVANALPSNFQFIIDEIAEDKSSGNVGIQWHVEADGKSIPFTRGASMYKVNTKGLISKGFDVPEPVLKIGSFNLNVLKIVNKILLNPIRLIPFTAWIFYLWFLFVSNIPPGANVFHMTSETFHEVINLSINFWLLLPITFPQWSPVVHPTLEGVFNFILIWSLLFAGFLIDGKRPNEASGRERNDMNIVVAGMQFLTNAFYLPYLFSREEKRIELSFSNNLGSLERFFESKALPVFGGFAGILFIWWSLYGRYDDYGSISERLESFQQLVSQDRLSFSFLFDGFFYALFQGWLIQDDVNRRTNSSSSDSLPLSAKLGQFIPFFGLVIYFLSRPPLPNSNND